MTAGPAETRCVVRGGGDLATGAVWRLHRSGFPVIVTELSEPMTVRRTVAVSTAVTDGEVTVEGLVSRRVPSASAAAELAVSPEPSSTAGPGASQLWPVVPVLVSPGLPAELAPEIVVDARMAKRNIDTSMEDAPLVVALGPGFTAGVDCHAVIETQRGPRLGRVLWTGSAAPDTGVPGTVGGRSAERVVRAPSDGRVAWDVAIGDRVTAGQPLGRVDDKTVESRIDGVVRGLIAPGFAVAAGQKIGDVDPRADVDCHEISDKALAIGGGVLEAAMTWLAGR